MSFVQRVMSEAVEKVSNSRLEKLSTFWNTANLRSRAMPAAILVERKLTLTAAAPPVSVIISICKPSLMILLSSALVSGVFCPALCARMLLTSRDIRFGRLRSQNTCRKRSNTARIRRRVKGFRYLTSIRNITHFKANDTINRD